jgi:hypothetical protein
VIREDLDVAAEALRAAVANVKNLGAGYGR